MSIILCVARIRVIIYIPSAPPSLQTAYKNRPPSSTPSDPESPPKSPPKHSRWTGTIEKLRHVVQPCRILDSNGRLESVTMEPNVSVPMARGEKPAATETAEPVDEPPGAYQITPSADKEDG
ncbi:hypothetical protein TMatcc_007415 [Talaromyces marneffei ATCC 18224]